VVVRHEVFISLAGMCALAGRLAGENSGSGKSEVLGIEGEVGCALYGVEM